MKQFIRKSVKKLPFYTSLKNWLVIEWEKSEISKWERNGKPVPPPHLIKQKTLRIFAEKFGLKILVETGTYYGDMVEAMKNDFDQIYSIELSKKLYEKAKKRFIREEKVKLIYGDSGTELGKLINKIESPALFWLDGHYSEGVTARGDKDTPIYEELSHILDAQEKRHVIIVDDASLFGSNPAYPSIKELSDFIKSKKPDAYITVEDDSIRVTPNEVMS